MQPNATYECRLCREDSVAELLDLGMQPICNRFPEAASDDEFLHPMRLGWCAGCGALQLINPVPAHELMPRVDWITYNEPEGHLDELTGIIRNLPGITSESTVCGISFKDDSTLTRLENLGVNQTWRIDSEKDLGIRSAGAGIETIQDKLTPDACDDLVGEHGQADVVIVRHILEHAHDTRRFTTAVNQLVKPNGYLVFEVPDCTKALEQCDFSCPWEEHVLYFTPESFRRGIALCGMDLVSYASYPYELEDSMVAIVRPRPEPQDAQTNHQVSGQERNLSTNYADALQEQRERLGRYLSAFRRDQGKVALLGAGHLACTFINLLNLQDHIEFVADDNAHKRGLFMPGSRLPIFGSEALLDEDIKLCLLTVAPPVESRVVSNNESFLRGGGTFSSIFPASRMALKA
jgi:hypothetical protein